MTSSETSAMIPQGSPQDIRNMTNRYTQDEWLAIFSQAKGNLEVARAEYKAPNIGTEDFAKSIDHTLLKLDATKEQVDQLCEEARRHNFKSVCVRLGWIDRAIGNLRGSSVVVACVIGFPEGTATISDKVGEARNAIAAGASELDMVLNYVKLKEGRYSDVYIDIAAVRNTAPHPIILKVILETSQLTASDIVAGCKIAEAAQADFVKTSTGFNGRGATEEDVCLMKHVVGQRMKVKASGGVKTLKDCVAMMEAGAERIGTSNGIWIMEEARVLMDEITHEAGGRGLDSRRPSVQLTRLFSDT